MMAYFIVVSFSEEPCHGVAIRQGWSMSSARPVRGRSSGGLLVPVCAASRSRAAVQRRGSELRGRRVVERAEFDAAAVARTELRE